MYLRKTFKEIYLIFTNLLEIPAGVILALLISVSTEGKYDGWISTFAVGEVNNCGRVGGGELLGPVIQRANAFAQGIQSGLDPVRQVQFCKEMTDMSADRHF